MRLTSLLLAGFIASSAHAGVRLVDDSAKTETTRMAKVVHKEPIFNEVLQYGNKTICQKRKSSVHYSRGDKIVITYDDQPRCKVQPVEEYVKVLRGYQITYEFKGKLLRTFLRNDPGEFVEVYSGE
jgi:hypothetical protein